MYLYERLGTLPLTLCVFSGLDSLQAIQESSTRKNAFSGVALEKLLDSNLAAKYALTGRLGKTGTHWAMG